MADTTHDDPNPIELEPEEASLAPSKDESNIGLHTSITSLQIPMASTPKFERYVPVSLIESLCEQVSQLSNEIKLLKEKQNGHANEKRSVSYVTIGTQTDAEIIDRPAEKDATTSVKKQSGAKSKNKNKGQTNNESTKRKRPVESEGSGEQRPTTDDHGNSATTTDNQTDVPLKRTLIIGSSITQNIRRRGLKKNSQVRTMSGAGVSDIRQEISFMDLSEISEIIVQVGGMMSAEIEIWMSLKKISLKLFRMWLTDRQIQRSL